MNYNQNNPAMNSDAKGFRSLAIGMFGVGCSGLDVRGWMFGVVGCWVGYGVGPGYPIVISG